jgi:hypothetical protein
MHPTQASRSHRAADRSNVMLNFVAIAKQVIQDEATAAWK